MERKTNCDFRETFLNKLKERNRNFAALSQREQFVYIFTNEDNMSLTWLGKFIYKSFQRRNSLLSIFKICICHCEFIYHKLINTSRSCDVYLRHWTSELLVQITSNVQCQTIFSASAISLLIIILGTNSGDILIKMQPFPFKKIDLKMLGGSHFVPALVC